MWAICRTLPQQPCGRTLPLRRSSVTKGGEVQSATTEQSAAPDCLQRPLLRRSRFRQQVSLGVIATRGRILYCWTRQGGCDPAMVSCHLFPPCGGVTGNGGVSSA